VKNIRIMEVINSRLDLQILINQNFKYHKENRILTNSHQLLLLTSLDDPNFKCVATFIVSHTSIFCFTYRALKSVINSFCLYLIKAGQYLLWYYSQ